MCHHGASLSWIKRNFSAVLRGLVKRHIAGTLFMSYPLFSAWQESERMKERHQIASRLFRESHKTPSHCARFMAPPGSASSHEKSSLATGQTSPNGLGGPRFHNEYCTSDRCPDCRIALLHHPGAEWRFDPASRSRNLIPCDGNQFRKPKPLA